MKTFGLGLAFAGLLALQVAPSAHLAIQSMHRLETGRPIRLAADPLDPRHLMRGEYSRLRYEIERLDTINIGDKPANCDLTLAQRCSLKAGSDVYVRLKPDAGGIHRADQAIFNPPTDGGLYIKGRLESAAIVRQMDAMNSRYPARPPQACDMTGCLTGSVNYGIGQWYGSQGVPAQLDSMGKNRIVVEARLGSDGVAVIDTILVDGRVFAQTGHLW